MKTDSRTGIYLALLTGVISGVSVYLNKYALAAVPDVLVFTALKNTLVGVVLLIALVPVLARGAHGVTRRNLLPLGALAVVGGSLPFLLFFKGLAVASAPSAALIHKSLFLWVALLAAPLLGETLGAWSVAGLALLAAGQLLNGWPNAWGWGGGESLILIATLLWAAETVVARKLLPAVSVTVGAAARMGGGALVMWAYLVSTNGAQDVLALGAAQWMWIGLTAALLLGYVTTWYAALQRAPATAVTGMLTLGAVITAGLSLAGEGKALAAQPTLGLALMAAGAGLLIARFIHPRQNARSSA